MSVDVGDEYEDACKQGIKVKVIKVKDNEVWFKYKEVPIGLRSDYEGEIDSMDLDTFKTNHTLV